MAKREGVLAAPFANKPKGASPLKRGWHRLKLLAGFQLNPMSDNIKSDYTKNLISTKELQKGAGTFWDFHEVEGNDG